VGTCVLWMALWHDVRIVRLFVSLRIRVLSLPQRLKINTVALTSQAVSIIITYSNCSDVQPKKQVFLFLSPTRLDCKIRNFCFSFEFIRSD